MGTGCNRHVSEGQALRLSGTDPVAGQWVARPQVRDALDQFSQAQDQAYEAGEAAEQNYLNADTVGGAELHSTEAGCPEEDYGTVWFPATFRRVGSLTAMGAGHGLRRGDGRGLRRRALGLCAIPLRTLGDLRRALGMGSGTAGCPSGIRACAGGICASGHGRRGVVPAGTE